MRHFINNQYQFRNDTFRILMLLCTFYLEHGRTRTWEIRQFRLLDLGNAVADSLTHVDLNISLSLAQTSASSKIYKLALMIKEYVSSRLESK